MKRFWSVVLAAALAVCCALAAHADEYSDNKTSVTFSAGGEMISAYEGVTVNGDSFTGNINETLDSLQPGDSATFEIALTNRNTASTDWYMKNDVLHSLEAAASNGVANGGAYTYDLRYVGPSGEQVLYSNERVGGESSGTAPRSADRPEGLEYATSSLGEEFFYLDTLGANQGGTVRLRVALDGETQGNGYQDTLAQLIMQFGVELTPTTTIERHVRRNLVTSTQYRYHSVRTGDENRILLWSLVMLGCGLAALVLAFLNHRKDRRERG